MRPVTPAAPSAGRKRRHRQIVITLLSAISLWALAPSVLIWRQGHIDYARASDCAIVLGAAAYHTRPSPVFEERIRHAIDLYDRGLVKNIVFTGGFGVGAPHAESEVGRDYALRHGVPAQAIRIETVSRTTFENLKEARRVMRKNGLSTAILVSDPYHLKRAATMAHDLGINAVTSPTPTSRFRSWHARLLFLARETYFYHRYLYLGY